MVRRRAGVIRRAGHSARRRGVAGVGIAALGLACTAVAVVGTSAHAARDKETKARNSDQRATVEIVDFAFAPAELTVEQGATVLWTNTGENDHTVTSDDGSFLSQRLKPGDTYRHGFRVAGSFAYHCSLHESMEGRVVVQKARTTTSSTPSTSATTTPSTSAPSTSAPSTTVTTVVTPDDLAKTGVGSPMTWLLLVGLALALGGIYVVWTRGPRPVMAQTRSSLPARKDLPEDIHTHRRDERDRLD